MKIFVLSAAVILAVNLAAKEVYFIPGWYSEWINYQSHCKMLNKIFPGKEIKVRKWESNRLWSNAKSSATGFAAELSGEIAKSDDPTKITLIGHSLGGRITLDCVNFLAAEKIRLKQIILLGTAGTISERDIANCRKVSILPVINIFCPDDNMLKLYIGKEKTLPLGFSGLPAKKAHFHQYRMPVSKEDIRVWQTTVIPEKTAAPFRQTVIHLAKKYLETLHDALSGNIPETYIDLPLLEKIAAENSIVPDKKLFFKTEEEFDNWIFAQRKNPARYRISSPSGKKFFFDDEKCARNNFEAIKKHISGK
ncbi:MAG: DUF726 domain-containing protein [Lentisphaeria bacterium]|nr:DUF726 domain-containing protein [Lentisphaeria bacterium]